jgi:hypothetical protein
LNKKGFSIVLTAAAIAALFPFAAGCGDSGESSEVAVQAGSLSKVEFTKKADAICEATRNKFTSKYTALIQKYEAEPSSSAELRLVMDVIVETALLPNYERGIDEIVALGAPSGDEDEVEAFLNALRERLGEMEETPAKLGRSLTPFARAEKLAEAYGLTGCAESLS